MTIRLQGRHLKVKRVARENHLLKASEELRDEPESKGSGARYFSSRSYAQDPFKQTEVCLTNLDSSQSSQVDIQG